jgi:hypothetical protein
MTNPSGSSGLRYSFVAERERTLERRASLDESRVDVASRDRHWADRNVVPVQELRLRDVAPLQRALVRRRTAASIPRLLWSLPDTSGGRGSLGAERCRNRRRVLVSRSGYGGPVPIRSGFGLGSGARRAGAGRRRKGSRRRGLAHTTWPRRAAALRRSRPTCRGGGCRSRRTASLSTNRSATACRVPSGPSNWVMDF